MTGHKSYLQTPTSPNHPGLGAWLLTTDHKRIGLLYMMVIMVWFAIAVGLGLLIRIELMAEGETIMTAQTYNAAFTLHGVIMIFLFIIPGIPAIFGNFLLPIQIGAQDVFLIYRRSFKEMPAWSGERDRAVNQGVHFLILTQPVGFNSNNGKLTGIKVCPTRLDEPDKSGRRRPETVESSAYVLDMDIVVEAIGQEPFENIGEILPGVELTAGLIRTNEGTQATSRPGVYAGGDLVRGASTVVAAVADGLAAANEMNEFMRQ